MCHRVLPQTPRRPRRPGIAEQPPRRQNRSFPGQPIYFSHTTRSLNFSNNHKSGLRKHFVVIQNHPQTSQTTQSLTVNEQHSGKKGKMVFDHNPTQKNVNKLSEGIADFLNITRLQVKGQTTRTEFSFPVEIRRRMYCKGTLVLNTNRNQTANASRGFCDVQALSPGHVSSPQTTSVTRPESNALFKSQTVDKGEAIFLADGPPCTGTMALNLKPTRIPTLHLPAIVKT